MFFQSFFFQQLPEQRPKTSQTLSPKLPQNSLNFPPPNYPSDWPQWQVCNFFGFTSDRPSWAFTFVRTSKSLLGCLQLLGFLATLQLWGLLGLFATDRTSWAFTTVRTSWAFTTARTSWTLHLLGLRGLLQVLGLLVFLHLLGLLGFAKHNCENKLQRIIAKQH